MKFIDYTTVISELLANKQGGMNMMNMKEKIREIVLSHGADLCGCANIDRFTGAPEGFHPAGIFSECKSVISFAVALPKGLTKVPPRLIYGHYNSYACPNVDAIAFRAAKTFENLFSCFAVPLPCDGPYEYWDDEEMTGRGLVSMKHIAVQAGLGTLGKSALLLNERYGSMLTLGAILTDLNLPSDSPANSICLDDCKKCVTSCPVGAINNGAVNQKLCRLNTYNKTARGFNTVDCNRCRTVCPMRFGATALKA
ncbi:MAG: epoxyqueuosine reductase [Oscillospiraceae bacterium]|nr:epoxyqueuosine reductase [Oscillospiraceae bacterium]